VTSSKPRALLYLSLVAVAALGACAGEPKPVATPVTAGKPAAAQPATALETVALIHGGAGPWVVAGYRMGVFAIGQLDLPRGSFDLEITHYTPKQVQYTCVADGAAAATGASLGKLNLGLAEATSAEVRTTYRKKSTGQAITLRPSAAFVARYRDLPREKLGEAGREVMELPEAQVFDVVPEERRP